MIGELKLEGYRGFESYKLEGLARVNLLVGKNNCGKSSILEAVQLLVSGDNEVLTRITNQRGEDEYQINKDGRPTHLTNISHFFHGHLIQTDSTVKVSCDIDLSHFSMEVINVPNTSNGISDYDNNLVVGETEFGLNISTVFFDYNPIPLTTHGILFPPGTPAQFIRNKRLRDILPLELISTQSLKTSELNRMWGDLVVEGNEAKAVRALQIIEPEVESIQFLSSYSSYGGVWIGIKGQKKRIPLGSMGEGMRRMLSLSLALANVQGGVLLIDEIDTGLHWTVMADMWKLIILAADEFDIQVFATTHSQDCIRGLGDLLETSPHLGKHVSLQTIRRELDKAVNLDGEDICTAVEQEIEVR